MTRNRMLAAVAMTGLVVTLGAGGAAAYGGDSPNPRAVENCVANIANQNGNGQTGANTGNDKDPKQNSTAVTNCDHYWQNIGAIGNN